MKRMQQMRLERGWSRAELARRAQMDASDIGRIEKGQMTPYPGQLSKIAAALGAERDAGRVLEVIEPD